MLVNQFIAVCLRANITAFPLDYLVCGSENEVAPIPTEDDHFDVTNRKMESGQIDAHAQKVTVWTEVVLGAQDQLCQRLAFGLSKIFATSTETNADSGNSETNIGIYDNFVTSCHSTYRDVMKKASFNQEMSEQRKSFNLIQDVYLSLQFQLIVSSAHSTFIHSDF